jgi:hypothetical protein
MQPVDLADLSRRPQQYWNVDGLPEVMMGVVWMVWGAGLLFGETLPHGRAQVYYFWFFLPLLVLSGFIANWVTRRLKQRFTFPRTGYVEWKAPSMSARLVAAGAALVTSLALAGLVLNRGVRTEQMVGPILGVILSQAFLVASIRQRAPHLLALGGLALAFGLALGAMQSGWESINWMFVVLGAASTIVGGLRLRSFLASHPRPVADQS